MPNKIEISNNARLSACEQVLTIWREADEAATKIGNAKARAIVAWFETTPPDLVMAGTDREACGVQPKTSAAVALSDTRAFFRVYREAPDKLYEIVGQERGFRAVLADVREIVKSLKAEAAVQREVKAAAKVIAVQNKADPEKAKAEIEGYAERLREFKADQALQREEQRKADAENPVKVAERIVRRLVKAHDMDFARAVAAAMDAALVTVANESAEEREAAEA